LVNFSLDPEQPFMELEYLPIPPLAEAFLYDHLHPETWRYGIRRVLDVWHRYLYQHEGTNISPEQAARHTLAMCWEKTQQRLEDAFATLPWLARLQDQVVIFNGRALPAWSALAPALFQALVVMSVRTHWSLLHGDFHFGNILFDFGAGIIKFIDPRGMYGEAGCYGDARYDLAKLLHGFHGGFTHLAADLFELREMGNVYELHLYGGADRAALFEIVQAWLEENLPDQDMAELILIEGVLFLSMVPLHPENPERQKAAYLIGLELVDEALSTLTPKGNEYVSPTPAYARRRIPQIGSDAPQPLPEPVGR
jgi:hypothetical protein